MVSRKFPANLTGIDYKYILSQMRLLIAFIVFLFPIHALAQSEDRLLICKDDSSEVLEMEIDGNPCDSSVYCFIGGGLYDLKPCAPNNGWGLSPTTGSANALSHQTLHWTEASTHLGGKFGVSVDSRKIRAAASFGEGLPNFEEIEGQTIWNVEIDRLSGTGILRTSYAEVNITCSVVKRKF